MDRKRICSQSNIFPSLFSMDLHVDVYIFLFSFSFLYGYFKKILFRKVWRYSFDEREEVEAITVVISESIIIWFPVLRERTIPIASEELLDKTRWAQTGLRGVAEWAAKWQWRCQLFSWLLSHLLFRETIMIVVGDRHYARRRPADLELRGFCQRGAVTTPKNAHKWRTRGARCGDRELNVTVNGTCALLLYLIHGLLCVCFSINKSVCKPFGFNDQQIKTRFIKT